MDTIRALNAVAAGTNSPAAALRPDAMAIIAEVASSERLTAAERTVLVAATVDIDQFITAQPQRAANLAQVAGLGMYLRQTSATTIPRWNVMTALRTYGLNIDHDAPRPDNAAAAAQAVAQKLEAVARSSRNVSLDTALAVAARTVASQPVAVQAAPVAKPAPVPKAEASAPAPRVEKIV